ncbi:LlaJI family restriction endonuclease [Aliivibrio fischeri]|uniref:LlaJI family restriction endonuclease n=1 Tax=Aliivibrio fischeri TaxID=668 RepID=UPI0012D88488|nr:LlaJI family restriction endonuclease [Aliivibrio fischeri]MUK62234.1 LlaJI family restriction endonuclease [Aliivibrio fischeri]MUK66795.1 LlaJI family restriction endonuclease [Aliivibrio fischeri]MUL21496.1 LlaJI family restriction endonuclease [Aliivibrio fischeri]MUL23481.1 LlaJI family restriction endonuclease [Aliivibrio fischeri]
MPQNKIFYLSDRISLTDASIPSSVIDALRDQGLIAPDMQRIHFCGVISYSDGLAVFLPRNHLASIKDGGIAGYYLLQALLKYYQDKDSGVYAQENNDEVIGGRQFSLAISLLDDYRTNGLYVRRVKENTVNSGKVNWSRTISRSSSYPASGGSVYLELQSSRARYLTYCETAKIHAEIIKELLLDYGTLWFGAFSHFDLKVESLVSSIRSIEAKVSYLERQLQLSYSERDMFLIKALIKYLREKKGNESNYILIGVRKFHNLWESMLDECLIGKYAVNSKLPVPVYQTVNEEFISVPQKGQRTDTVLKHSDERRFAVIDAKYYEASSSATAPGWPDLVKQFYYQQAVRQLEGEGTLVSNHFIFPGCNAKLKSAHIASRGVEVKLPTDCLDEYGTIHCHYQDPIELLEFYVKGEKLSNLTNEIFSKNE